MAGQGLTDGRQQQNAHRSAAELSYQRENGIGAAERRKELRSDDGTDPRIHNDWEKAFCWGIMGVRVCEGGGIFPR